MFSLSLTDPPNLVAHVGGTLLGGAFDAAGGIYLADATRGLLYLPPASSGSQRRSIQIAAAHAPSSSFNSLASDSDLDTAEIRYCNDIAIDSDTGLVYFTDSGNIAPAVYTTRRGDTFNSFSSSFLSADATGRLLVYNPETGDTSVLVTEIPFANGVGVNPRTKHVIFASSTSYSIRFVPLPPSADDISASPISFLEAPLFFDGKLPGVPDGLTVDRDDGSVYVPVFGPLSPITKIVNIAPPFVLRILVSAPHFLRPKPRGKIRTLIVHLDQRGELIRVLHDTTRQFGLLTSVERCGKHLFCGALKGHFAARFEVS